MRHRRLLYLKSYLDSVYVKYSEPLQYSAEWYVVGSWHGMALINYLDTEAKCRHLKKMICKGSLWQVFIRVYF
jgi:hypothetical protein